MYGKLISGTAVFFALIALYSLHSVSSRDPTSIFFNPRIGYKPAYSTTRKHQAENFIEAISNRTATPHPKSKATAKLCVGIPSIARKGARYLRTAVGSLLEGLTAEERNGVHLIVFIPHSDPTIHPAYTERWLPDLVDKVLEYDVSEEEMNHIKEMEQAAGLFREKGLYDYSYLVKECYKQDTPYIVMLEDDIVVMDGWYHRTVAALEEVERKSALTKASPEFLYLRLFYTEEFLGWNAEEWKSYLGYSVVATLFPTGLLLLLRSTVPSLKRVPIYRLVILSITTCSALILIFFSLGRATVLPLHNGVSEMPKYGCCSQGFVFPREKALTLAKHYEERKFGFVDVLTEEYADTHGELRWAITPSVVQHVGMKSSKVDDYGPDSKFGMTVAEKIWNFRFEKFDVKELKKEHERVTGRL
ncbi:hypothetical protein P154DRAFT_548202 [Amniculicola lignicola CBS 123094]|uniref:Integral membrane protein-like protein n=1 Tax=Amniculicola lignicola CBS 123094 TaxID=1392246 RepID=A0A6A5W780_9PLEO|nr:hypothetical protein P154DRAFT_548202 [Amniculicola lignicola CBS 123094]